MYYFQCLYYHYICFLKYSKKAIVIDPDKIGGLVMDIVPKDSCLIFCSNRKNCENIALLMTKVLFRYIIYQLNKMCNMLKYK